MTHPIERIVDHRPFPPPRTPWVIFQSWRDLLFAHWPIPVAEIRPLVPPPLAIDEFDGTAWVTLSPFRIADQRFRPFPPMPGLADFPEMNFRTYVRAENVPGIFFFSLDAGNRAAVKAARIGYRLPYFHAEMEVEKLDGEVRYRSRRRDVPEAEFAGRYRPIGPPVEAVYGSLEYFLVERYALFTVLRSGRILRGDIHHPPWLLHSAEAEIERLTVPAAHGVELPGRPALLQYCDRQDTLIWPPRTAE